MANSADGSSNIKADAEAQWLALPACFRLETPLKLCNRKAIERDFLVSARLNHMHVLFLLRLALVTHGIESDVEVIRISGEMLGLAVEALMLKHQLANSGTGLVWKVSCFEKFRDPD